MSHSWEPKKLGTSYSETTSLLGLKLWLQGVLMRTLCCRSFKSNWCLVSACKASQLFGSQEWDIFFGTPCSIQLWFRQKKGAEVWCVWSLYFSVVIWPFFKLWLAGQDVSGTLSPKIIPWFLISQPGVFERLTTCSNRHIQATDFRIYSAGCPKKCPTLLLLMTWKRLIR